MVMLLYLSENITAGPEDERAHPSGTRTLNPVAAYATNAWLSGMSPGGLVSTTVGPDADEPVEADEPAGRVEAGKDDEPLDELHAGRSATAAISAASPTNSRRLPIPW